MAEVTFSGWLSRIIFDSQDSDFKIVSFNLDNDSVRLLGERAVTLKGEMELIEGTKYKVTAEEQDNKKYGMQYDLISLRRVETIESMDKDTFRNFLATFISIPKLKSIYDTLEDPQSTFMDNDVESLIKVKGIGDNTARRYFELFESQKDYGELFVEFNKWGFTKKFARKAAKAFRSADLAISTLNENPYKLMRISGVGFKMIDQKALEKGIKPNDKRRVKAFIDNFFLDLAMEGNSWISFYDLLDYLKNEILECDLKFVVNYIQESEDYVVYTQQEEKRVASKHIFETEKKIAQELLRIMLAPSNIEIKDSDKIIKKVESLQGWQYSEEQLEGIKKMLNYNVFLLQGLAGTGKSSVVNAFVQVLDKNNYNYKQCALSGKAAQNLASITGEEGSTIHRLLGYTPMGFSYNKDQKIPTYAVILDEISMVDIDIFYHLVQAIPSGAKLIMIGDGGQLDSIGVGVMEEMINSKVIPSMTLKQIHRQAKKSAMITHSISFRNGKYPEDLNTKSGTRKLYGEKKDLGYTFVNYNEEYKIKVETMKIYKTLVKKYGVKNTQIITPTISNGVVNCDVLNDFCQRLVNPANSKKNEIEIKKTKDRTYILREGDKVINVRNNRKTVDINGESTPIFNGNTGIINEILLNDNNEFVHMIVNFDGIGNIMLHKQELRALNLGYAITVHKSQGSTLDCVIIAMPFQFKLDSRELLYTAITRAAKLSYVITSPKTLKFAVGKTSKKQHKNNLSTLLRIESKKIVQKKEKV